MKSRVPHWFVQTFAGVNCPFLGHELPNLSEPRKKGAPKKSKGEAPSKKAFCGGFCKRAILPKTKIHLKYHRWFQDQSLSHLSGSPFSFVGFRSRRSPSPVIFRKALISVLIHRHHFRDLQRADCDARRVGRKRWNSKSNDWGSCKQKIYVIFMMKSPWLAFYNHRLRCSRGLIVMLKGGDVPKDFSKETIPSLVHINCSTVLHGQFW